MFVLLLFDFVCRVDKESKEIGVDGEIDALVDDEDANDLEK
jgi:hypothetical protein